MKMIAIALASFVIDLPERVNYISMGVGCCCFIHSKGYARACYKDKANTVPTPFLFVNLSRGDKGNLINKHMAIFTFLLIVGLAYVAYKTCPKKEYGSIKK